MRGEYSKMMSLQYLNNRAWTHATIENLSDLWAAEDGGCPPGAVRRIDIDDALVDTGATKLALPTRLIASLGLRKSYVREAITCRGRTPVNVDEAVRLTLLGRFFSVDVMEVPDEVPVFIGEIPLEMLDLVVDPQGRQLIGNPAHGGEHVLELF